VAAKGYSRIAHPADEMASSALRKLKLSEPVLCEIRQPPKRRHASKFWRLITTVWQATGQWDSPEDLLVELKVKLGIVREVVIRRHRRSCQGTRLHQLCAHDQGSFDQFFERALRELCLIAGGIDSDALREAVLEELAA